MRRLLIEVRRKKEVHIILDNLSVHSA